MHGKNVLYTIVIIAVLLTSCSGSRMPEAETPETISSNPGGKGQELEIKFTRGEAHNHPLMAFWVEDQQGNYIQTLFVAESIGKGIFDHGDPTSGKWLPGAIRRPAALPVWSHSRGVKEPDGLFVPTPEHAIPDAYTGATPQISFILNTKLDNPINEKFWVCFEINQTWDWNEYWTNNKYPDDDVYKTSCQPSLIYKVLIDPNDEIKNNPMKVVGRGHHSGKNGEIYTDLETMTTALDIAKSIEVIEL